MNKEEDADDPTHESSKKEKACYRMARLLSREKHPSELYSSDLIFSLALKKEGVNQWWHFPLLLNK